MQPTLRRATQADIPQVQALIAASVRGLSAGHYTPEQVESALLHMFGVDSQLIDDGSYLVIEDAGRITAAGGWSARRTLFGGDQMKGGEDPLLDPATEPARIRAFFVHPAWARRGLARLLFARCQEEAGQAGFRSLELLSTLPGEPLYTALGFTVMERVTVRLPDGVTIAGARMVRPIDAPDAPSS